MVQDVLLSEVDRDLRDERLRQAWKKYRTPIIACVALLVLVTAGGGLWSEHKERQAGRAMQHFDQAMQAMQKGQPKEAAELFATLANSGSGELHDLALLWQGRALVAAGEPQAAHEQWLALAKHPQGADLIWRDMACLRLLSDGLAPKACAAATDSPLKAERMEWQAAQAWQDGKSDEARRLLKAIIADEKAANAQRARAERLLAVIGTEK